MRHKKIVITELDRQRLSQLIEKSRRNKELEAYLDDLQHEVERAKVVDPHEVPADVITMNSTATLTDLDSGEQMRLTLVFPSDADAEDGKISVMAPLGTAMLGFRVGDSFDWEVPVGRRRWRVDRIDFQPEASGRFDL